ncbi:uncharacterized protein EI90DRAFT_3027115 [Cantharellus anzutake]|uniref:uncharacterized protein n=1 Tax=Cantharellus anzutake TaxID=1750568 RepID=UPI00190618E7|nr:uncharacterized protein EI90DRAFT_3027115 [Cantharellus anzutake]KAF8343789.1 hypothetical protein EI90DRAFT_3027115 [Cantharellus anzutake]
MVLTFTLTDGDGTSASYQAINSLMLVATMLSMSGAITATLSMRWYSIVPKDSVQLLAHRRSYDQGQVREDLAPLRFRETIFERTIPFALNTCIHLTNAGFLIFVAGILTYAWIRQETPVAIVTTVSAGCGLFCMSLFYLPFEFRYVIHHLHFMRFQFWPPPATRRERRSALQSPREETSKASASV